MITKARIARFLAAGFMAGLFAGPLVALTAHGADAECKAAPVKTLVVTGTVDMGRCGTIGRMIYGVPSQNVPV